jgi:hypothetical protein
MPLAIRFEGNWCLPIVVCDHCEKEIRTASDGNYQWLWDDKIARIYFTHKACCNAFEERHGGFWGAIELECLPVYLVKNLEINWRQAKWRADFLSRL